MLQISSIVRYPAIVAFRSFAESLALKQLHEQAYRDVGFQLIDVPAGPLAETADKQRIGFAGKAVMRSILAEDVAPGGLSCYENRATE
jgi:predicted ATPase